MSEKVLGKTYNKKFFLSFVKGIFTSLIVSVVGILLFAVVLKFVNLSDNVIKILNQIIKILSVFLGVRVIIKNNSHKAIIKGFCLGAVYTALSYLLFSVLSNNFSFGLSFVIDLLFAGVFGIIFGIICKK